MDISKISAGLAPPRDINVFIEIPQGGLPVKYELDKESGALFVNRFLHTTMFYPGNYGFIPNTLSEDGDACDALVVSQSAVVPGAVVRCRPVGALMMEDEAGKDEKIITVPVESLNPYYKGINSYTDLPILMDTGIKQMILWLGDVPETPNLTPGTAFPAGVSVTISAPPADLGDAPVLQYSFVTGDASQPMAPAYVEWRAVLNGVNTGIHHPAPQRRDQGHQDHAGVAAGQLSPAVQHLQLVVGPGGEAVVVGVAAHVEQRPVVHAPQRVPGVPRRDPLEPAGRPAAALEAVVGDVVEELENKDRGSALDQLKTECRRT